MNKLKEKLQSGRRLCGTHVSLADPCICDIIGRLGFDFIWVDCEHSYLSLKDVLVHLSAAGDTPVIVRLQQHDFNFTKKVLEMGPAGVVFPMVKSAAEAEELMQFTLYPPKGCRGFGPMRAIGYGQGDINHVLEYVDAGHEELCRFIQIEQACAVEELPLLVQNPYIDGYIFGPNDLSGSIGHMGRVLCPENQALIQKAMDILQKAGKPAGVSLGSTDQETLDHYAAMGMQILSTGADYGYVLEGAKNALHNARLALEKGGTGLEY